MAADLKTTTKKHPVRKAPIRKGRCSNCASESWSTFFIKEAGLKNVHVVPNIVPPPASWKRPNMKHSISFFLGFIYQKKGIFDLIDVIVQNKEKYRDRLKLYVGGTGQEYARLIDTINANNINDIVILCGWVNEDDKIKLLNIADAYILPSYVEGLPMSILEAMSYGMPILSTPVGGIPEIVENGVNGFLFPPGDKQAMQNSINKLISNPSIKRQMGTASLQKKQTIFATRNLSEIRNNIQIANMTNIAHALKTNRLAVSIYKEYTFYKWMVLYKINPKIPINHTYKKYFNRKINWENPQDLIEKIAWMELYGDTSLWTTCADKYRVREYVEKCGCGQYLNELLGVWKDPNDINFKALPSEFVLKANNGCGTVLIVNDKTTLNIPKTKKYCEIGFVALMAIEIANGITSTSIVASSLKNSLKTTSRLNEFLRNR